MFVYLIANHVTGKYYVGQHDKPVLQSQVFRENLGDGHK